MSKQKRLAAIRKKIIGQNISYGEIVELQSLIDSIDESDTLLLEWAGVPERFGDDE